jgi:hypothetical protein
MPCHLGPGPPSSGAAIALKPSLKVLVAHGATGMAPVDALPPD